MKKLIALIPILFLAKLYKQGEELPTHDSIMVDAWLENGSATWFPDEEAEKPDEQQDEVPDGETESSDEQQDEVPDGEAESSDEEKVKQSDGDNTTGPIKRRNKK